MIFSVRIREQWQQFSSNLTENQAREACLKTDSNFAHSLAKTQHLSDKQLAWLHYLAIEQLKTVKPEPIIVGRILVYFQYAIQKSSLKRPIIRFMAGDREVKLCMWRGHVSVFINERYQCRIENNGHLHPPTFTDKEVIAGLLQLNKDPLQSAKLYGERMGCCCFCRRILSNQVSIQLGYGPVCAEKFGMHHDYSDDMRDEIADTLQGK